MTRTVWSARTKCARRLAVGKSCKFSSAYLPCLSHRPLTAGPTLAHCQVELCPRAKESICAGAGLACFFALPFLPGPFSRRSHVCGRPRRVLLAADWPLAAFQLPFGRHRAPRSDGYRCAGPLVWVCGHHGLNSLQPPVPILAALVYKPDTSLKARAALQVTMFSTPHFCHASFALRCTAVGAAAASVSSVSLPSMSRRRANRVARSC